MCLRQAFFVLYLQSRYAIPNLNSNLFNGNEVYLNLEKTNRNNHWCIFGSVDLRFRFLTDHSLDVEYSNKDCALFMLLGAVMSLASLAVRYHATIAGRL